MKFVDIHFGDAIACTIEVFRYHTGRQIVFYSIFWVTNNQRLRFTVANFTNILWTAFQSIFLRQKTSSTKIIVACINFTQKTSSEIFCEIDTHCIRYFEHFNFGQLLMKFFNFEYLVIVSKSLVCRQICRCSFCRILTN